MNIRPRDIEEWIIDHQSKLIIKRYQNVKGANELLTFFLNQIYAPPNKRRSRQKRTEIYFGLSKSLAVRFIMATLPKDIEKSVKKIIEIYEQTSDLEDRLIDRLYLITQEKKITSPRQITEEMYKQALRESCTYFEKRRQLENILELADLIRSFIERGSVIFDLVIKFLSRYGAAEIIVEGYNLLKKTKGNLDNFKRTLKEEETRYLNLIFKK